MSILRLIVFFPKKPTRSCKNTVILNLERGFLFFAACFNFPGMNESVIKIETITKA